LVFRELGATQIESASVFIGSGVISSNIREAGDDGELVGDLAALVGDLLLCGCELLLRGS
jgi:hypothetical protein